MPLALLKMTLLLDMFHVRNHVVWYFLEHDGTVTCQVIDRRRHGKGLEVPCMYHFTGKKRKIEKLRKLLPLQQNQSSDLP